MIGSPFATTAGEGGGKVVLGVLGPGVLGGILWDGCAFVDLPVVRRLHLSVSKCSRRGGLMLMVDEGWC